VARLKQLLVYQTESSLLTIELSWIIEFLKKETPEIKECILLSLPLQIQRHLKERMKDLSDSIWNGDVVFNKEISQVLMNKFEEQFVKMPYAEFNTVLSFPDIILLSAKDWILLLRELGKIALATSFASLGVQSTAQFISHYSQAIQNDIVGGLKDVNASDVISEKRVKPFLETVFVGFHNAEDLFQKSGLYLVASSISKNEIFLSQLAQRLPYAHGQMLFEYKKTILKSKIDIDSDNDKRKSLILSTIVSLSSQKIIDGRFSQCSIHE